MTNAFLCQVQQPGPNGEDYQARCEWPLCHCDPYAVKVLHAVYAEGYELTLRQGPQKPV